MSIFDTFSHGFDLPAGVQLNRINKKLFFWETTQNNIEEEKQKREDWAKKLQKDEKNKDGKMDTYFKKTAKERLDAINKKREERETRIKKYLDDVDLDKKEVWQQVK